MLEKVVALRGEEAAAVAGDADPYDALLDDYVPGATGAELGQCLMHCGHGLWPCGL